MGKPLGGAGHMGLEASVSMHSERLELYRIMVETVTANEARRHNINSVFFSLFVGIAAAGSAIEDFSNFHISLLSLALSIFWYAKIKYLRDLATSKFKVILRMEREFCDQPFSEEWRYLGFGEGFKGRRITISDVELSVPLIVFFLACFYLGGLFL